MPLLMLSSRPPELPCKPHLARTVLGQGRRRTPAPVSQVQLGSQSVPASGSHPALSRAQRPRISLVSSTGTRREGGHRSHNKVQKKQATPISVLMVV